MRNHPGVDQRQSQGGVPPETPPHDCAGDLGLFLLLVEDG